MTILYHLIVNMLFVQNLKLQVIENILACQNLKYFITLQKGVDWESAGEILDHEERQRLGVRKGHMPSISKKNLSMLYLTKLRMIYI
jgi:hypothetical protein